MYLNVVITGSVGGEFKTELIPDCREVRCCARAAAVAMGEAEVVAVGESALLRRGLTVI